MKCEHQRPLYTYPLDWCPDCGAVAVNDRWFIPGNLSDEERDAIYRAANSALDDYMMED